MEDKKYNLLVNIIKKLDAKKLNVFFKYLDKNNFKFDEHNLEENIDDDDNIISKIHETRTYIKDDIILTYAHKELGAGLVRHVTIKKQGDKKPVEVYFS